MAPRREVLFEMKVIGRFIKVSAMDAETLTEVSIVGNPGAGEAYLKAAALRKLEYVLSKRGPASGGRGNGSGGGILV
ncbi:MAG: hypothetical protein HY985_05270 [Magnetospirillum sp.]|nr:hypothetical protein [Magnetospirillum sp.]